MEKGFSLIECLVVMGCCVALGVMSVRMIVPRRELGAEREVIEVLQFARVRALREQREERVRSFSGMVIYPPYFVKKVSQEFTVTFYPTGAASAKKIIFPSGCTVVVSLRGRVTESGCKR